MFKKQKDSFPADSQEGESFSIPTFEEIELLKNTPDGQEKLFNLVKRLATPTVRIVLSKFDYSYVEDAIQATAIKVWENLNASKKGSFEFKSSLKIWIIKIAFHEAIDIIRRAKARRFLLTDSIADDERRGVKISEKLVTKDDNVLDAEIREIVDFIFSPESPFNEQMKTILFLRYEVGLGISEVAEMLDLEEGTLKSRTARAFEDMRAKLKIKFGINGYASVVGKEGKV